MNASVVSLFGQNSLFPSETSSLGSDYPTPVPGQKVLRDHQVRALDMLQSALDRGKKRIIIQAACGFGKTLIASRIIEAARERGETAIFTVPALSLLDQSVAAFEAEGLTGIGVIQGSHPRTNPAAKIQVASVQTLARRRIQHADIVLVDEVHIRSKVIEDLIKHRPDITFIGLSATPWTEGLGSLWQEMVVPIQISELIEKGYLSEFKVFAPSVPDLSGVKVVAGDYKNDQVSEVMQGHALMANVVQTWLERGENRPTILFGSNCAHAKELHTKFENAGVAAAYVDGMTDLIERKLIEDRFHAGEIRVVCSVRTLSTGIDWNVSCLIDAAPTRSTILHVQKIGRGLRVNEGTEDCLILDHAGNSLRLGLVTEINRTALDAGPLSKMVKVERAEKLPKPCPSCEVLFTGVICPSCGFEKQPQSGVEVADGELVELTPELRPDLSASMVEKQTFLNMCNYQAEARGTSPSYAQVLYRERFGVWPSFRLSQVEKTQPDENFVAFEVGLVDQAKADPARKAQLSSLRSKREGAMSKDVLYGTTEAEREMFYGMAVWIGQKRGYSDGYAASIYRKKYQRWPARTMSQAPIAPDQKFLNYEQHLRIAYSKTQGKN